MGVNYRQCLGGIFSLLLGRMLFIRKPPLKAGKLGLRGTLGKLALMKLGHDPGGKVRRPLAGDVEGDAIFGGASDEYRYVLRRVWNRRLPATMFVMMNPSVADIDADDPTVARCQAFARSWGSGCVYVGNTFAYRTTDKRRLLAIRDPIGPDNDRHLLAMAKRSHLIVVAYGQLHKNLRQRGLDVCSMLKRHGHQLYALKLNTDGTPKHPLYLRSDIMPFPI